MSEASILTDTPSSPSTPATFSESENSAVRVRRKPVPERLPLIPALASTSVAAATISRDRPYEAATGAT